ncbi:hypothetical protein HPB48_012887 [Haemaphysalis longicornis]|uniref:PiggyBac transposable element-derived protein domain-containing protein n=1 Tax=Haemaphysalis longicornis TaxID=44386 RepID=A0A9J6GK39_HAELO|nr:hypothetical protein HPB48_012887 [Haemaphysalis longicornis]
MTRQLHLHGFPSLQCPNLAEATDENDILGWFHVFFDWDIIDLTVTETNQFSVAYSAARGSTGKPVDRDEIMVFLALIILQGIVGKPHVEMYWSTKKILETPVFSKAMSRNRFNALVRCLHFTNFKTTDEDPHPHPRLWKLWPVITRLNEAFLDAYVPKQDVSVDESLLLFMGRLARKESRFCVGISIGTNEIVPDDVMATMSGSMTRCHKSLPD